MLVHYLLCQDYQRVVDFILRLLYNKTIIGDYNDTLDSN